MNGNLWEWSHDYYGLYNPTAITDPVVESGAERVFRGGAWNYQPKYLRSTDRNFTTEADRKYYIGFRIGRTM